MSSDKDFEDNFLLEGNAVLKSVIPKMVQIWNQLGFPPNKTTERFHAAISHHKELWDSMLEEEQNNKKKILSTIDRLGRQQHLLCRELGTEYIEFGDDVPLLEMEKKLEEIVANLKKDKEERMKSVRALFAEDEVLCRRLGKDTSTLNKEQIPTPEQFRGLQDRVANLKAEVASRQKQYLSYRDSVRTLFQQLEMAARSAAEVELFVSDPNSVSLSDSDMSKIKELLNGLKLKIEQNEKRADKLRATIETLWERLSVEGETREIFLMENRGFAPSTIQVLERELAHLEELKRQNIERFIVSVREDLQGWWDRCYVSENERREFAPYYAASFTEELLELHEMEVEKYKTLHNDYKDIFLKVHHRENLWKRMLDIEARGRDPSRLFGNRGCALLQEEKERKKIVNELPRVEQKLGELFNDYERTHGKTLYINGRDYRQHVAEQWAIYENSKENEKLQRQKDRAEKLQEESKGGAKPNTPMKRRLGTTGLRTHIESPNAKHRKLLVPTPSTAPQQRPNRRVLTEAMVNQLPQAVSNEPTPDVSMMSTYSAFTMQLRAKKDINVNSTVVMEDKCSTPIRGGSQFSSSSSTLPRRRSPRLACLTPTPTTPMTQLSMSRANLLRRSKTQNSMMAPLSTTRITPARSTPQLSVAKHRRPFLV